jgi:DNA modification methylase
VTSPPYFGLRRYAGGTDNDFGRERSIEEYIGRMVVAMREVRRVLRDDGVCFLNIADSYHGSGRGAGRTPSAVKNSKSPFCDGNPLRGQGKAKSLCLIPQRTAIALQDDGWIVRNDVVWQKPNCVPDSVQDRCTSSYEHILVLTKNRQYFWNTEEAREPSVCWAKGSLGGGHTPSKKDGRMKEFTMRHGNKIGTSKTERRSNGTHGECSAHRIEMKPTRNLRDVWTINTQPHRESHIAMFPEKLAELCIKLGSKEGDLVLDPFAGSGTTGLVAKQLGRNAILLDISEEYVNLINERIATSASPRRK